AGQDRGMTEVAVEHEGSDLDRRRDRGGGSHCRDRTEALVEVIGNEQRRVPHGFDLSDRVGPRGVGEGVVQIDGEAEAARMSHAAVSTASTLTTPSTRRGCTCREIARAWARRLPEHAARAGRADR